MKNRNTFKIFLMLAILLLPCLLFAQDNVPGDPDNVPIDGGLSLLIAAGLGYGANKLKKSHASKHVSKA